MTYYETDELYKIAKLTGKPIYVHIGDEVNGFLDEIEPKKLYGYLFAELFHDDDTYGYFVEPVYWDTVFDCDDDGYYNLVCREVYGEWSIDHFEYTRDESPEDKCDENVEWTEELINEITC